MKNKSGNCALTTAIRLNDLAILKVLLDNSANVNTQNKVFENVKNYTSLIRS